MKEGTTSCGTLFNQGTALARLGRFEEAIVVFDDLLARFGDATEPGVRETVVLARYNKGTTLNLLERSEEALAVFDDLLER
jgi:hypothetical protein